MNTDEMLERLKALQERVEALEVGQERLQEAYARSRLRFWLRPPMWRFQQYPPRQLDLREFQPTPAVPTAIPKIAIVTPSFNHADYLADTIDSILGQNYPSLSYHVQDGNSNDGSVAILESYGDKLSWRSAPDKGQADAINRGFADVDCDIMAYLNSDDILLPGTLAYIANFFSEHPDVDVVYGHRVFIDAAGLEIGRAIFPAHDKQALLYAGYIPQETMFWRKRVWDAVGSIDLDFQYALDWDFMLRTQNAGFKFARARRFLACFRVHDKQKTTQIVDVGREEMRKLRFRNLGYVPSQLEIYRALSPYLVRQLIFHWSHRLGILSR